MRDSWGGWSHSGVAGEEQVWRTCWGMKLDQLPPESKLKVAVVKHTGCHKIVTFSPHFLFHVFFFFKKNSPRLELLGIPAPEMLCRLENTTWDFHLNASQVSRHFKLYLMFVKGLLCSVVHAYCISVSRAYLWDTSDGPRLWGLWCCNFTVK